ncbi:MAG: type II secretion system protein [Planctomycetota bacterium]
MTKRCNDRDTAGFTLVEILVTIAIIALLVGILLPVLGASRQAAKAAACLSNVQQIGLALHSYATENDGFFINYRSPYSDSAHRIWHLPVLHDDGTLGDWWSSRTVVQGYLPTPDIFFCPGFESTFNDPTLLAAEPTAEHPAGPSSEDWNAIHYGINVRFLASRQGFSFPEDNEDGLQTEDGPYHETPRLSEIRSPSATISIADSKNRAWEIITQNEAEATGAYEVEVHGVGYLFPADDPPEIQFGYAHARHAGSINVGWVDGHASSVSVNEVDNPYKSSELTSVRQSPKSNKWDLN